MTIGERIRAARKARRPPCTQHALAQELSQARWGTPKFLDRQQVYRWETGKRVPTYWLPYLEQVLGVDLSGAGVEEAADTVASVIVLGSDDVERRRFVTASASAGLAALDVTDAEALSRRADQRGPVRVSEGEVAAVRSMTAALADTALELGGGHARHLAVRYLIEDVGRLLEGSYTERVGRELFAAASALVHLIGWMARDVGAQGLAQQYHVHSYKLAAEAGENELAATALRGLAGQALDLGHIPTGVRLAEACEQQGRAIDNLTAQAYYRNIYARALAADADGAGAVRQMSLARRAIERAPAGAGGSWASHYSHGRWAHESGMIHAALGDLQAAEEHLRLALDVHGLDRRRTHAIVLADLGEIQLKQGNTAGALKSWQGFLDTAAGVHSVRVSDAISNIRARLRTVPGSAARSLNKRLHSADATVSSLCLSRC
ncbi:tetratricopeptide repeat protein [Streptomyces xiamenensis]